MNTNQYSLPEGIPYARNAGYILRGLLNGVKHDATSFAHLYGLNPENLEDIMNGKKEITREITLAVENHPPLNARALFDPKYRSMVTIHDDTTGGVAVYTNQQTSDSKRVLMRGPDKFSLSPFYEYHDTAMTKKSTARPEWIKLLYFDGGVDRNVPDWLFNEGHAENQVTFFLGNVNFHWMDKEGNKYIRQMHTGDVNYITPFVPHSFTTREEGNGFILAITFGGAILTEDFQSKIQSMKIEDYMDFIEDNLPLLSRNLATEENKGVIFTKYEDVEPIINKGLYCIRELMSGIPSGEYIKVFEYINKGNNNGILYQCSDSDRWGYNIGNTSVQLLWRDNEIVLGPGGSFIILPNTPHAFRNAGAGEGKLVIMDFKPSAGNSLEAIALIKRYSGKRALERIHTETLRWF